MSDAAIPVSEDTLARLRELARWAGTSVGAALDEAVREQYDRKFWDATNAGYAALRADPTAWADVQAEREHWDRTLMDGLDPDERWPEGPDGGPPGEPGSTP
jgi:hypothetical protein